MTIETRIISLAQAIGTDVKTLTNNQGSLSSLTTTAKNNIVAALNEIRELAISASGGTGGAVINDAAGVGAVTEAWSADKIIASIAAAKAAVKSELTNGASAALDTLSELAAAIGNDANFAATLATQIGNRVRYDAAQTLTAPQKTQVLANIGAASTEEHAINKGIVDGLVLSLGSFDRNYVADYTAAKA